MREKLSNRCWKSQKRWKFSQQAKNYCNFNQIKRLIKKTKKNKLGITSLQIDSILKLMIIKNLMESGRWFLIMMKKPIMPN